MKANPYYDFVRHFFISYGCSIVEESNSHMKVQLTSTMDEELMNRPFYWHYMKKMNCKGEPMQLTFTHTDQTDKDGIYLHAGSPRLHSIYKSAMKKGKTTRLYETVKQPIDNRAMTPWLVINIVLHYRGKTAKDEEISLGLNLVHGTLVSNMMGLIWEYPFESTVSDYTFPMTPVIGLESGYKRIQRHIEDYLYTLDHDWAKHSIQQLRQEKELLESFFQSGDISQEQFIKEQEQIETRYKPRISAEVVNGGLFYISRETSNQLLTK